MKGEGSNFIGAWNREKFGGGLMIGELGTERGTIRWQKRQGRHLLA